MNAKTQCLEHSFYQTLNERQRRLYAGLRASELGVSGVGRVSKRLHLHPHTVRNGKAELRLPAEEQLDLDRVRQPGGGRKKNH